MKKYFFCLFCLLLNLLIYGYEYGVNSYHSQDLPFIDKILNPALFPDDIYVNTLNQFPSLYIYFMAFAAKFFPLETIHFSVFLGLRYLSFLMVFLISRFLFKKDSAAGLGVFLLASSPIVNSFGLLSEQPFLRPFLYHGSFTVPFLLLSLYWFLKERFMGSLGLLAGLFYFNALAAAHCAVLALAGSAGCWDSAAGMRKKYLFLGWVIFALALIPWMGFAVSRSTVSAGADEFVIFLRHWFPGHYFPLSWPVEKWERAVPYLTLFCGIFFCAFQRRQMDRRISFFLAAIFFMWLLGFIFAEIFPWRPALILQPWRSDALFVLLGVMFAAALMTDMMESKNSEDRIAGGIGVLLLAAFNIYFHPVLAVSLAGMVLILAGKSFFKPARGGAVNLIACGLSVFCLAAVFVWFQKTFFLDGLLLGVYCAFLFGALLNKKGFAVPPAAQICMSAVVLLAAGMYIPVMQRRIVSGSLAYREPVKISWQQTQRWARDNTPQDACLVVPPYINGFRTFSQRGVFIERLDGGVTHWSPGIEVEWANRMEKLGYGRPPVLEFDPFRLDDPLVVQTRSTYAALREIDFLRLQREYGVNYTVTETFHRLNFPLVYRNAHFLLYRIIPRVDS